MSFTGIEATINFYTMQESSLTNEVTDILFTITQATKKTSSLIESTSEQRQNALNEYGGDVTNAGYQAMVQEINDNYQMQLSDITAWESELNAKKQEKETTLKATTSYKESLMSMLKQNVQKDPSLKYGQSGSSS